MGMERVQPKDSKKNLSTRHWLDEVDDFDEDEQILHPNNYKPLTGKWLRAKNAIGDTSLPDDMPEGPEPPLL